MKKFLKNLEKVVSFVKKNYKKVIIGVVIVMVVLAGIFIKNEFFTSSTINTLGFENIGELATQSANGNSTNVIDKPTTLAGITLPFGHTKIVYSFKFEIKAGYDFSAIEWQEKNKTITVKLPEAKVLSNEIDTSSLKVYHENESMFKPISISDLAKSETQLKKTAQKDAIDNGLLTKAKENAKTLIKGFIQSNDRYSDYEVKFVDK